MIWFLWFNLLLLSFNRYLDTNFLHLVNRHFTDRFAIGLFILFCFRDIQAIIKDSGCVIYLRWKPSLVWAEFGVGAKRNLSLFLPVGPSSGFEQQPGHLVIVVEINAYLFQKQEPGRVLAAVALDLLEFPLEAIDVCLSWNSLRKLSDLGNKGVSSLQIEQQKIIAH